MNRSGGPSAADRLNRRRLEQLVDAAVLQSRRSVEISLRRVRSRYFLVAECSIGAGLAYVIAGHVLGHQFPVYAPIVAVICLGMSFGQRMKRVLEFTIGVSLGLIIADLTVTVIGRGWWQIALIVLLAQLTALLLSPSPLFVNQMAVQSIFVIAMPPSTGSIFERWTDALVGGGVALLVATIAPASTVTRPRAMAADVVGTIAALLHGAAQAARDGDVERAAEVLVAARSSEAALEDLSAAAAEGLSVIQSSPFRRRHAAGVRTVAELVLPLDRALRTTRVLVRRVSIATAQGRPLPPAYAVVLDDLAVALEPTRNALNANRPATRGASALVLAAAATDRLSRDGSLATDALLAQIRSLVVDLLQVDGLDYDEALEALPTEPGPVTGPPGDRASR